MHRDLPVNGVLYKLVENWKLPETEKKIDTNCIFKPVAGGGGVLALEGRHARTLLYTQAVTRDFKYTLPYSFQYVPRVFDKLFLKTFFARINQKKPP